MAPNENTDTSTSNDRSGRTGNQLEDNIPSHAAAMKLLDLRLKPSTAIIAAVSGEFTGSDQPELCMLKSGGTIEIHRIVDVAVDDDRSGTTTSLKLVSRVETRSILRSCAVVRFPEEKRDSIVVGADGGCISVLDFLNGKFRILHCVSFGKTACRRVTPGQYVASDPKGRAVLIAAIEKKKLVYVLNRDGSGNSTIASPLEANRSRTITYATTGLDNGYDNPIFAAIECQYPDLESDLQDNNGTSNKGSNGANLAAHKQLAYYELDLGLNHVSRKWAIPVHSTACCIVAAPGGADGPGGVFIGSEDWIEYNHYSTTGGSSSAVKVACAIPRRKLHPPNKGILVTNIVVYRQRKTFFALAQTELGDVYKVTVQLDKTKNKVVGLSIALLDTLPTANALCVSKLGTLFCASEFGNHYLYRFLGIDLPNAPTNTSQQLPVEILDPHGGSYDVHTLTTKLANEIAATFQPTALQNLRKIVTIENPSPFLNVFVAELAGNEVSPQIYTLTGRGPVSALSILRHGASVSELAVTELPGIPGGIFTVADNSAEATSKGGPRNDQYIIVSFADATLVLSVGDTVEEVGKESGLLTNAPTLACSALGTDGAMCQVHPSGVRQIHKGQAKQWHCPGLKRIECASANESQVIISLAGGEVICFDFDPASGNLTESAKREMGVDVCSLDVGTILKGRSRSMFAAIGCRDQTVRIVSLEPGKILQQRSSTALRARPHSVSLQFMSDSSDDINSVDDLTLVIGLDDGSSLRANIDPVTGSIDATPTRRFLGARPVSVSRIMLESQRATLLLSSRPWISRRDNASGRHIFAPLSFAPLDHGCSFSSEAVKDGIVATAGRTLRILSVDVAGMGDGDDETFNSHSVELRYTARQMTLISAPLADNSRKLALVLVESDYNEFGLEEKLAMGFDSTGEGKEKIKEGNREDDAMDMDDGSDDEEKLEKLDQVEEDSEEKEARRTPIRGPVPPSPGHWGSCVRLVDPVNNCSSLDCVELGRNEAALCCASVRFHSKGGEPLLAVGTVTGMTLNPTKQLASHILLYRILNCERLQLLHRTTVDDGPILALAHFQGRLLVGMGKSLRLYEMGKRQLLRKCELRRMPTCVRTIQTVGDRAFVGDLLQSIQLVRYDATSNRLTVVACDPNPRPIVCQELLDWNTVAIGDKFGNISVLRLPRGVDGSSLDLQSGQRTLWESSRDDTTPKLEVLCQYYVGEVVTGMTRSSLIAGGAESLIYVTVTGRIGALVPFTSRADVEFYTQLESLLRTNAPRPTGRDPLQYRSYYAPVMHVVDGDLCDAVFNSLGPEKQTQIAERLDFSVGEVLKKLEDTRNGLL